jgi:hypothetical protein
MAAVAGAAALLACTACDSDTDTTAKSADATSDTSAGDTAADTAGTTPTTYTFASRFGAGSSVSYEGQAFRHILILDLKTYLAKLGKDIDSGTLPKAGDVVAALNFYYKYDGSVGKDLLHGVVTDPASKQKTYGELHPGANLQSKMPGVDDPQKNYRDWSKGVSGWQEGGVQTPDGLAQLLFARVEALALARAAGNPGKDPTGKDINKVFVSADGIDYAELIQKYLTGAISVSQALDDYLDEGLAADNAGAVTGKTYSDLEHAWDEGFGYFGASRDFGLRTDAEVSAVAFFDTNNDSAIDLQAEFTFGHAANASKRDGGSKGATDYSADAWTALLEGRALIARAGGALSSAQQQALAAHRDVLATAWEKTVAATTLHYINELASDVPKFGKAEYDFYAHAKHWSELKGFALSLQFFPTGKLTAGQLDQLHQWIGDKPVLPTADAAAVAAHAKALDDARTLLATVYGIDSALAASW